MKKNSIPQLVELSQKGDSNAFELLLHHLKQGYIILYLKF